MEKNPHFQAVNEGPQKHRYEDFFIAGSLTSTWKKAHILTQVGTSPCGKY